MNSSPFDHSHKCADQCIGIPALHSLQHAPKHAVRLNGTEKLRVLNLSGEQDLADALGAQDLEELRDFAQAEPVNGASTLRKFGRGFFLDGDNQRIDALVARRLNHQKRKPSVACDDGEAAGLIQGSGD